MSWVKKVCVIVKCRRSVKDIKMTLKSLFAQFDQNFQVICLVDQKYKTAKRFLQKAAAKTNRIEILSITTSLNIGKRLTEVCGKAKGEYCLFVNSGDTVTQNWIGGLVDQALRTDSDLVFGDLRQFRKGKSASYYNLDPVRVQDIDCDGNALLDEFMKLHGLCSSYHSFWNKLIRLDLWELCRKDFDFESEYAWKKCAASDLAFSVSLFCNAKHAANLHGQYYYENVRQGKKDHDFGQTFGIVREILNRHRLLDRYSEDVSLMLENCVSAEESDSAVGWFRSIQTQEKSGDDAYKNLLRKIYSGQYKIISFNIFDTLVVRPFVPPSDIFTLLNVPFQRMFELNSFADFSEQRRSAEEFCRISYGKTKFVDLNDIYDALARNYGYDREKLQTIQALELENEISFGYPRKFLVELFELAKKTGKKIVLASESYLPRECIEKILRRCGISGYDRLFLSHELDPDAFPDKFAAILDFYKSSGIRANQILHIGDDACFDIELSEKAGISSFHCPSTIELFQGRNPSVYTGNSFAKIYKTADRYTDMEQVYRGCTGLRCVNAVIANKLFDNPFQSFHEHSDLNGDPRLIGYYLLGTHIFAVARWLIGKVRNKGIRKVHFAARDGYLIQKAYDILAQDADGVPESNYIRVSRKAFAIADIKNVSDMQSLAEKTNIGKQSPDSIFAMFQPVLTDNSRKKYENFRCSNKNFCQTAFGNRETFARYIVKFYDEYLSDADFDSYHTLLSQYFQNIIAEQDVIFDIGYSGRIESALQQLLGFQIKSYYIHTNNDSVYRRQAFTPFENETFYHYKPNVTGVIREHFLSEMCPSTVGYMEKSGGLQLIDEEYHIDEITWFATKTMQESALEFVSDLKNIFGTSVLELYCRNEDLSKPFEYYLHYSRDFDRRMFAKLECEDDLGEGHSLGGLKIWNDTLEKIYQSGGHEIDNGNGVPKEIRNTPRWKRALYFFIFEPKVFWEKLKNNIGKK